LPIPPSVGSFRRAGRLCPRDLAVALRSAVSGELPCSARLLDFVQIQVDDQELAPLPSSLPDERAGRTRDAALAVKLADTPRPFVTHAMDRSYDTDWRRRMPAIRAPTSIRKVPGPWLNTMFRAVQPNNPRPSVKCRYIHTPMRRYCVFKHRVAFIPRGVGFLPESG
jgi:hypothetical protein